jgi:UDP-glucose 4-epimerase
MNILITGGAGYVGTKLVKKLAQDNAVNHIVVYDNLIKENYNLFLVDKISNHEKINFIHVDILDSKKIKKILENIDIVYHLAAKVTSPFANVNLHYYEQINNWGTAELSYAIEDSHVKKVIYLSSMGVYGFSKEILTESSPTNPSSFYAISKLKGERHIKSLSNKTEHIILRCGNVYGYSRSMRFDAVINKFVFESNFNNRIIIQGSGDQHRAFIHIDAVSNTLSELATKTIPSGTYNFSQRNFSVLEIMEILKETNEDLEFVFVNQQTKVNEQKVSDDQELKKYIDYSPKMSLKEEIVAFQNSFSF